MGDGSLDRRYKQVFFSNKNKELLVEFAAAMQDIFGIGPRIWQNHEDSKYGATKWGKRLNTLSEKNPALCMGLFYPTICGKILQHICGMFADGHNKMITKEMQSAPLSFKQGLLRALFDDEASCDVDSYMIRMHQDNKALLEDMRVLLKEMGVETNPVRSYMKRGKLRSYFNITRKNNFSSFVQQIGFTSTEKQAKVVRLMQPRPQRCVVTPTLLQ